MGEKSAYLCGKCFEPLLPSSAFSGHRQPPGAELLQLLCLFLLILLFFAMSLIQQINKRQLGSASTCTRSAGDLALAHLRLTGQHFFNDYDVSPPLALALEKQLVATVTEYGQMYLVNADRVNLRKQWQAHYNAIFDVKWRPGFPDQIVTASGDQSIVLWDINAQRMDTTVGDEYPSVTKLEKAHKSSIKSISFSDENIFSSGARDGIINIWDLRCPEEGEVAIIPDAHRNKLTPVKSSPRGKPASTRSNPMNSVTCVLFQPNTPFLFSSGANDGAVKMWDIRNIKYPAKSPSKGNSFPAPAKILPYLGTTSYSSAHGFTSLAFDSSYRLYASCSDHHVYCYHMSDPNHALKFGGHQVNNFTRIKIFNDYLVSGSTDASAYIWSLKQGKEIPENVRKPIYVLPHFEEVTALECDSNNWNVFTCSDDQRLSKWSLFPGDVRAEDHSMHGVPEAKALPFSREDVEVVSVVSSNRAFFTPPSETGPLTSLSNWLVSSKSNELTPSINPSEVSESNAFDLQSTPSKKRLKENRSALKAKRSIRPKKQLFNRKISDYFHSS